MNTKVNFKNKLSEAQYERHILTQKQRLDALNKKIEATGEIETAQQYMKIANSIFGERRHNARKRVIKLIKK